MSNHRPVLQKFISYSESVTDLNDDELCQLIIDLQSSGFIFSSHPFDHAISKGLYQEFLSRFTGSNIPARCRVVQVMEIFTRLEDCSLLLALLLALVEKVCLALLLTSRKYWTPKRKFSLLLKIVSSAEIWKSLLSSSKDLIRTTSYEVIEKWTLQMSHDDTSNLDAKVGPSSCKDNPFQRALNTGIKLFIALEKKHPSLGKKGNIISQSFSSFFSKIPVKSLFRLMKDIYAEESKSSLTPNLKSCPCLVNLCRNMARTFSKRPSLRRYIQSYCEDFVVHAYLFFVWTEECPLFFVKQLNCHHKSHRLVNKIISSLDVCRLVSSASAQVRLSFLFLLDHRIAQLTKSYEALGGPLSSFTWQQPWARFPSCATIQSFLRSPSEKLVYGNFVGIAEARKFGQKLRDEQKTGFYRVSVEERGIGRNAKCHVSKIHEGYDLSAGYASNLKKELDKLTQLRLNSDLQPKTESIVTKRSIGNRHDVASVFLSAKIFKTA